MAQIIQTTFQFKRGDAERWNELNPILAEGEPGFELDTNKFKIGNGINTWKELPYKGEGNIVNAQTHNDFPTYGNENAIYKAQEEKLLYQWNPNISEYEVLGTFEETGNGNLITVDTELSASSMNPVANKVITIALQDFVEDHYTKQEVDTVIENTNKRIDLLEGTTHFRGIYPNLNDESLNSDLYEFSAGDIFIVGNSEYICTTNGNLALLEKANYEKLGDVTAEVERISALEEKVGNEENGDVEATGLYQVIAGLENNKLDKTALNNYYNKDETYTTIEIDSLLQEIDRREEVTTLGELIDTIIGDDIGLSMRTVAIAVVAEIVGKAPEAFDTLEEIAAWIEAHPDDVAAIITRISNLETSVDKKVDKTDIINTLDSTALDKPLSAAMGKELNSLIKELSTAVNDKVTEAQVTTAISNALKVYPTTTAMQTAISTALVDYIKQTELNNAINTALQTAKESGDFDGTSVTVSKVTESAESGGENVVEFSDGETLTVRNGRDGSKGDKGDPYTLTEADKVEIANKVILHFGGSPVQCVVTDDAKIILTGVSVGTYTAYFDMGDGELVKGGVLTLSDETPLVTYTVTFVADGMTVATIEYTEGDTELSSVPDVPAKDGYTGVWESYDISEGGNITVNAIYTEIPANTYRVTKTATHCVINGNDSATEGEAYTATVTANSGYEMSSIKVTMTIGGADTDITSSAVNGGNINITNVTGNITITATATKVITNWIPISTDENNQPISANGLLANTRLSLSSGNASTASGCSTTGFIPVQYNDQLYLEGTTISGAGNEHITMYKDEDGPTRMTASGNTGTTLSTFFEASGDGYIATLNSGKWSAISDSVAFIRISSPTLTENTILRIKRNGEWQ